MDLDPAGEPAARPRSELGAALKRRALPVYGLERSQPGRIGGSVTSGDLLTCIYVDYGDEESWLRVQTANWTGTIVSAGPLQDLLKHHLRLQGELFADQQWSETDAVLLVDGQELPGREVRAGDDWWAVRVAVEDVEISLIAYRWKAGDELRARTPAEVDSLLAAPHVGRRPPRLAKTEPIPAELDGEPHRALVDTVLSSGRRHRIWLEEGGPVPELPAYWRSLWTRAVHRQAELADQPEAAARSAVESLVDQLTRLQQEAGWFRDDAALRERAVAETLLWTTRLGPDVPSRTAQQAWQDRDHLSPPIDRSDLDRVAAADARWIEAWHAWALNPQGRP